MTEQAGLFGNENAPVAPLPPAAAAPAAPAAPVAKPKAASKTARAPAATKADKSADEATKVLMSEVLEQDTERMVTIILEESVEVPPTGQFVGVNGRSWMIRPGEEVTVPVCVLEALNDACSSVPRTDQQGNVVDYRDKQRLPYRIVRF